MVDLVSGGRIMQLTFLKTAPLWAFILIAGLTTEVFSQCSSWTRLAPKSTPNGRLRHVLVHHSALKKAVMFGGVGVTKGNLTVLGDTWLWNGSIKNWEGPLRLRTSPTARYGSSAVYDEARKVVVLFGGADEQNNPLSDTWEFDGSRWTSRSPSTRPTPRLFHSMSYDSIKKRVVLFGGLTEGVLTDDTWSWNGNNWSRDTTLESPPVRDLHSTVYDSTRSTTLIFGGFDGAEYLSDLWELKDNRWRLILGIGPSARIEGPLSFEPTLRKSVMFGGLSQVGLSLGDTWTWNGITWEQLRISGPAPRRGAMLTFDPQLPGILLFGGTDESGRIFSDTWKLTTPDSDADGTADCMDECPNDPFKTTLGANEVCANNPIIGLKPKRPTLRMIGKRLRVRMQKVPNARYAVRYYHKVGNKKRVRIIKRPASQFLLRGLRSGTRYVFDYRVLSTDSPNIRSRYSATRTIKVKNKR